MSEEENKQITKLENNAPRLNIESLVVNPRQRREIVNGYTVKEFDTGGPRDLDRTIFVMTFKEALEEAKSWEALQIEALKEEEKK